MRLVRMVPGSARNWIAVDPNNPPEQKMKSKKITNLTIRNLVGRLSARLPLEKGSIIAHLRRCFCALAVVGASLTLPNAEAGPPEPASGGFYPCFNFASPPTQAGPNTVITFSVI